MKIGIDITALQTGHRMRGIGYTIINFINNINARENKNNIFFFYAYKDSGGDPFELINIEKLNHKIIYIEKHRASKNSGGVVERLSNMFNTESRILFGDKRIRNFYDIDIFIQPDQNMPLPPKRKIKSVIFLYDIIPYVMREDYLWDYKTARINGKSRKGAIRHSILRSQYIRMLKANCKRSDKLVAISQKTKDDFIHYIRVSPKSITVCPLGVDKKVYDKKVDVQIYKQVITGWGYRKELLDLNNIEYLLFIGGVDPRRKLSELIAAFNNLRARGVNIYLVLAGDSLFGPKDIPNAEINKYLTNTSYKDYIYFLGFTSDTQRDWLYANALAFVYPSVYEGFGLPVLESMVQGCPVIAYKNNAVYEVAENAAIYTKPNNFIGIMNAVNSIIESKSKRKEKILVGNTKAQEFSWNKTSAEILKIVIR